MVKNIFKSEFLKSTLTLTSGTVIGQAISIFTAPLITRIFLPAEYDVLGIYLMVTGIFGGIITLQCHNFIVTEESNDKSIKALNFCVVISSLISILFFLSIGGIDIFSFKWYENNYNSGWYYLIPFSLLFNGLNLAFSSYAVRKKDYNILSKNKIYSALLIPICSISLGLLYEGPGGLIIGLLMGQFYSAVMLILKYYKELKNSFHFKANFIKQFIIGHRHFIKYAVPSESINGFVFQLPVMMIAIFFNAPGVIGNYNLSNRMLSMPVQLVSNSVLDVFRQKASAEYGAKKECSATFLQTLKLLFFTSLIPFILLFLFGPLMFKIIFGDQWELAGRFSQVMAPFFFLKFIASPLSYMYYIAGRQKEDFVVHIVLVTLVFLSFFVSQFFSSQFLVSLICYTSVYCLLYTFYLVRSYTFSLGK